MRRRDDRRGDGALDARRAPGARAAAWLAVAGMVVAAPAAARSIATATAPQSTAATAAAAQDNADAAVTAWRSGRYEEAINALRQRTRVRPSAAIDHRHLAAVLIEVGRYDQAEAAARAFIADNPLSAELYNQLGEALWATGRLDEAEEAFRRAVDGRASDRLTAELNLAIAAFDRGRRREAMQRFDRFIDYYNDGQAKSAADLTAVGVACRYLGIADPDLFKDALRAFDEAVAADAGDLTPRVLTGELFLEKYDSGAAADELAAVLQLNPQHPGAQLAMAQRMEFDGDANAAGMVDSALHTNPNMVGARVFRARALLASEFYDEAILEIAPALEINPNSLDSLAVLAAAHWLRRDEAAFAAARDRALAANPGYADLYNTLADLAVQNRLYAEAVDFARQAITLDAQSWRGYSILGVNQLRIGDIDGGRASLEASFAGDPYNVWVKNTLDLLDTFPGYVETTTERFVLMIEKPEAALLSLYVGPLAERAYDYFAARYHYEPPTPIRIEVYPSHADFSVRTVGLAGLGALGVSFGPVVAIDSPSARPLGEFNWGSTLWHEIAHTFTLSATDFRIPRWLSEGLSVYEERRAQEGWGDDVSAGFLIAHLRHQLLPVSRITDGFVRPAYPQQVVHSYYQASLVCELIERDWGFEAILALLDAYKNGLSTEAAFEQVLGLDAEAFDAAFTGYLEETFAGPLAALRPAVATAEGGGRDLRGAPPEYLQRAADENPQDFLAQLAYGAALFEAERYDEALPYLEGAKRLFPAYAEADSPYWYLAMIARQRGDNRRAAAELEALTAVNENQYEANLALAGIYEQLDEPARAAHALERAIYIYPLDIPMQQRLAALDAASNNLAGAVRARRAVVALAPVDMAEALYLLARAQFDAGDRTAARRSVLGALEIAPGYPDAQQLLLAIVGGEEVP